MSALALTNLVSALIPALLGQFYGDPVYGPDPYSGALPPIVVGDTIGPQPFAIDPGVPLGEYPGAPISIPNSLIPINPYFVNPNTPTYIAEPPKVKVPLAQVNSPAQMPGAALGMANSGPKPPLLPQEGSNAAALPAPPVTASSSGGSAMVAAPAAPLRPVSPASVLARGLPNATGSTTTPSVATRLPTTAPLGRALGNPTNATPAPSATVATIPVNAAARQQSELLVQQGVAAAEDGHPAAAVEFLDRAIAADPTNANAYEQRGWVYYNAQDFRQAMKDYNSAQQLSNSQNARLTERLGLTHAALGNQGNAISQYSESISLSPDAPGPYVTRGRYYADNRQYPAAVNDYSAALAKQESAVTYNYRGQAYAADGDYAMALIDYNAAIKLDPTNANYLFNRGQVYALQGSYPLAVADFTRAVELNPQFARAYFWRSRAMQNLGEPVAAVEDYRRAIALDPSLAAE